MVNRRGGSGNRGGRGFGGGGGRGPGGRPPGGGGRGAGGRGYGSDRGRGGEGDRDRGYGGDRGRGYGGGDRGRGPGGGGRGYGDEGGRGGGRGFGGEGGPGPRGEDRPGLPRRQPPGGRGGGRGFGGERGYGGPRSGGTPGYREDRAPERFGGGRPGGGPGGRGRPPGRGYDEGDRFGPPPRQPGGRPRRPDFDIEYEGGRVGTGASAGREYIWGRNAVAEAIGAGRTIHRILLAPNVRAEQRLDRVLDTARERGVPIVSTPAERIEQISPHAQGIAAEVDLFKYYTPDDLLETAQFRSEPPMLLALDQIEDPQNLGTLLRTAEAVGVHGVLIPEHRSAQVTGSVVKASAGAAQYLRVARVTNLKRELEALKSAGIWIVGIEADGEQAFDEVSLDLPFVLVVGGEDHGLGRTVRETCDVVLRIPTVGKVSSLNAATAGSIVLHHLWRQRQKHAGTAVSSGDVHLAEDAGYEIPPMHAEEAGPREHVHEYGAAEASAPETNPNRPRKPAASAAPEPAGAVTEVTTTVETTEAVSAKPKRSRARAASPEAVPTAEEAAAAKPKRARKAAQPAVEPAAEEPAKPKRTRKSKAADTDNE